MIDFRSVLVFPFLFKLLMRLVGVDNARRIFVKEYVRPEYGDRVLDVGCGPCDILEHLPAIEYVGIDMSQRYIDRAKKQFGNRGIFICQELSNVMIDKLGKFDTVVAFGVLHHLNDDEVLKLLEHVHSALKPGGKLVTYDGVNEEDNSPIARFVLSKDRGQYIRTTKDQYNLVSKIFRDIEVNIRRDLTRIYCPVAIMVCKS